MPLIVLLFMANIGKLRQSLLRNGIIDAEEAETIKNIIYEDGKIDKEEADFLFELNNAVTGKKNVPVWKYVYVLENETVTVTKIPQGQYYLKLAYGKNRMLHNTECNIR